MLFRSSKTKVIRIEQEQGSEHQQPAGGLPATTCKPASPPPSPSRSVLPASPSSPAAGATSTAWEAKASDAQGHELTNGHRLAEELVGNVSSVLEDFSGSLGDMTRSEDAPRRVEFLARALNNLALEDTNRLKAAPAIRTLIKALKLGYSSKDARLCEACCGALQNLAVADSNRKTIATEGGIEAIIEAMRAFPEDKLVQEWACGALSNLAVNDGIAKLMRRQGEVATLVRRAHAKDVQGADETLRNLQQRCSVM